MRVGALESVPLMLKDNLKVIDVGTSVELFQKCALLGSRRMLRKVLASPGNLLLPGANEESSFNIVSCVNSQ